MIVPRRYFYNTIAPRYTEQLFYIDRTTGYIVHTDSVPEGLVIVDSRGRGSGIRDINASLESFVALKDDGTVIYNLYTDNPVIVPNISNVVNVSTGGNSFKLTIYDGCVLMITKDHKLYAYGIDQNHNTGFQFGRMGTIDETWTPIELTLPNNEVPFMCSVNDSESIVVTMKGNVYWIGSGTNIFEVKNYTIDVPNYTSRTFMKLPITNVVWGVAHNSTIGNCTGLTFLKHDGTCWTINKNAQITKVLDNIVYIGGSDGDCVACDINGNAYLIRTSGPIDLHCSNIICGSSGNETATNVIVQSAHGDAYLVDPSNSVVTWLSDPNRGSNIILPKIPEVVQVSKDTINDSFVSTTQTNTRTFYIKTTFEDVLESDYSRNVVNYVTEVKF